MNSTSSYGRISVAPSPHIHKAGSTASVMWSVVLCLIPAGAWGVYVFGTRALLVIIVSIAASLAGELIGSRLIGRATILDGSAFLTGLLVAYNMPVGVPLFIPAVASLFAILVVKWSFGGLGTNWMNPALAGRVFVFFSWTGGMTRWNLPLTWGGRAGEREWLPPNESLRLEGAGEFSSSASMAVHGHDAITGATPLGEVSSALAEGGATATTPTGILAGLEYPVSGMGESFAQWFSRFGVSTDPYKWDLFLGNVPGCIGEVSALFLLVGAVYLMVKKIVNWEIPLSYLGSFSVLVWIFAGVPLGNQFFSGDVIFHLMAGGLMLGALFMATDYVTAPTTRLGMILYGVGCGGLTYLIRMVGSFPEGVSLAIILMNIFVPLIDRVVQPRRYGVVGVKE